MSETGGETRLALLSRLDLSVSTFYNDALTAALHHVNDKAGNDRVEAPRFVLARPD